MKADTRTPRQVAQDALRLSGARRRLTAGLVDALTVWDACKDAASRLATNARGHSAADRFDYAADAMADALEHYGATDPDAMDADCLPGIRLHVDAARKRVERERAHRDATGPDGPADVSVEGNQPDRDIWTRTVKTRKRFLATGDARDALTDWAADPHGVALADLARDALQGVQRAGDADAAHWWALDAAADIAPTRRPVNRHVYLACYAALRDAQGIDTATVAQELDMRPDALRKSVSRGYALVRKYNAADDLREWLTVAPVATRKGHASPAATPWRQSGPMVATLTIDTWRQRSHAAMNAAAAIDWQRVARDALAGV